MRLETTPNGRRPNPVTRASDLVYESVEAVAAAYERIDQATPRHVRGIELLGAALVRPWFLFLYLFCGAVWVGGNLFAARVGLEAFDVPPFFWFQGFVTCSSLATTIVVLITQNRQGRLIERRAHLELQVNLLAERKVAKIIDLLEELRRDSPTIKNRYDGVAEAMAHPADPLQVVHALEGNKDLVP